MNGTNTGQAIAVVVDDYLARCAGQTWNARGFIDLVRDRPGHRRIHHPSSMEAEPSDPMPAQFEPAPSLRKRARVRHNWLRAEWSRPIR